MDVKKKAKIQKALLDAGVGELLAERLVQGVLMTCDESCRSGCAACCETGTANRAFSDIKETIRTRK